MDHFEKIYANQASEYHRMIAVEDLENNLTRTLEMLVPWENKKVVDLGSGTGRFPIVFQNKTACFTCLDLNRAMLLENHRQRELLKGQWSLVEGDMRTLPLSSNYADIVIAGWAIGHLRSWFADNWQKEIGKILSEMQRIAGEKACIIICETMSTGSLKPKPPVEELAQYYRWIEEEWGFEREVISTDYQFDSVDQAVEYTEFFFGAALAADIRANNWARLPEWTGIWYKYV